MIINGDLPNNCSFYYTTSEFYFLNLMPYSRIGGQECEGEWIVKWKTAHLKVNGCRRSTARLKMLFWAWSTHPILDLIQLNLAPFKMLTSVLTIFVQYFLFLSSLLPLVSTCNNLSTQCIQLHPTFSSIFTSSDPFITIFVFLYALVLNCINHMFPYH